MESVKISPKKCEIAMALGGHHSGLTTAPPLLDTKGKLARFVDEGITNNQSHSLRASSPIWASDAKNARARGRGKESLQPSLINFHFHPGNPGTPQSVKTVTANVPQIRKVTTACQVSLDSRGRVELFIYKSLSQQH